MDPEPPRDLRSWDPYPGALRSNSRCMNCGVGPLSHVPSVNPNACHEYLEPVSAELAELERVLHDR